MGEIMNEGMTMKCLNEEIEKKKIFNEKLPLGVIMIFWINK